MKTIEPSESSPINIWMVEDNSRYRKSLASVINNTPGMQSTMSFSNCEDAFLAMETETFPDVILLDIGLPGMSGIKGIQKFKSFDPTIHIVILTIYEDNDTVFDALCEGASGYLLKDSTQDKIVDSIREVLAGGAPLNMRIAQKVLQLFSKLKIKKTNYGLTERETEILQHIVKGETKQQIADELFLSFHTVNTHIKNIYKKLEVNTKAAVVSKAFTENLFKSEN
ncbi:MAG: response regulator transcription factor [Bacteroidales bacterium]|nr:response regulator transcription factor [Bacteroidales bacterium]MCB9000089.1 response regulator transcription factor [Bacteroidales bacterium]MCB9012738.1 response regulator transcription factor [Bacteroidales bacterium]